MHVSRRESAFGRFWRWASLPGCPHFIRAIDKAGKALPPVSQSVTLSAPASIATTPDLWRGVGSGAFLVAQPLLLLGATPTQAIQFTFILTFILGGAGCASCWASRRFRMSTMTTSQARRSRWPNSASSSGRRGRTPSPWSTNCSLPTLAILPPHLTTTLAR